MATVTTLQIGTYNAQADTFTTVLDLNDRATYFAQSVDLGPPEKVYVQSWNVRSPGATTQRWQYKNRPLNVKLFISAPGGTNAITAAIHALYNAIEDPVGTPYVLKITPAGGTNTTYWPVAKVIHSEPYDALRWQQGVDLGISIDFEVSPKGFTIPRQVCSNLVPNPGFEAPIGGTLAPAVTAFADPFANVNAYAQQAPGTTYRNAVLADAPIRYYRLDDTNATAVDSGSQAQNGTYTGGFTQSQAGALAPADNDTATLFNGTTGIVTLPTTGMPTGAAAMTLECWAKYSTYGGTAEILLSFGTNAANQMWEMWIGGASGNAIFDTVGGAGSITGPNLTPNVWHHLAMTWDGATFRGYVDGVLVGSSGPPTPSPAIVAGTATIAARRNAANNAYEFFAAATIDEVAIYATALSAARIATHYAAGLQAGPPATGPANTYVDIVQADTPLRYYRLGEVSGTSAFDIGSGGQTGTYVGSPTLGAAGALSGDTDKAVTFNGTSQAVSLPTAGLPTGSAAFTLECWVKIGALNTTYVFAFMGINAAGQSGMLWMNNTNHPVGSVFNTDVIGTVTLSVGVWTHLAVTYSGGPNGTVTLYVNGVSNGTPLTVTANLTMGFASIGAQQTASNTYGFWTNGTIDEVVIYGTALSAARLLAHYNAGNTGATGTVANAMSLPAGGRVAFGSPAWGALQTWQCRFRWVNGLTANFYLHYTDASNYLLAQVAAGTNACQLIHSVGGTLHVLSQFTLNLVHEAWYWLVAGQYPARPSASATMLAVGFGPDPNAGAPPAFPSVFNGNDTVSFDNATSVVGRPQIAASGAALVIGGLASGAGNQVALFGPGGWLPTDFLPSNTYTPAGYAWEGEQTPGRSGNAGNTYPTGPVTSQGCARTDLPPTGAFNAAWYATAGGTASQVKQSGVPVKAATDTFGWSLQAKANGLAGTTTVTVGFNEYDVNGNFLRQGGPAYTSTFAPATTTWQTIAGTYTPGNPSCAYLVMIVGAADANASTISNGKTVWYDNVQVWDQTTTGMATMPWHDMRGPLSPYQLTLSGLLGDTPAPALTAIGTYLASWAPGNTLTLMLGRKLQPQAGAVLVAAARDFSVGAFLLNAAHYGGFDMLSTQSAENATGLPLQPPANLRGAFQLLLRCKTQDASIGGAIGNFSVRAQVQQLWTAAGNFTWPILAAWLGTAYTPLAANNVWQYVDAGFVQIPPFPSASAQDPTQVYHDIAAAWTDSTLGGGQNFLNTLALVPVDGGVLTALANNPGNSSFTVGTGVGLPWFWVYADGLPSNIIAASPAPGQAPGKTPAWSLSLEAVALAAPAHAYGGVGTQSSTYLNINPAADSYLVLDPTTKLGGVAVNQALGYVTDGAGDVLPFFAEIIYQPQYLYLL